MEPQPLSQLENSIFVFSGILDQGRQNIRKTELNVMKKDYKDYSFILTGPFNE